LEKVKYASIKAYAGHEKLARGGKAGGIKKLIWK
jgi:hypothetical protein